MPKRERIHRVGLGDPRTGRERIAGVINRAVQPKGIRDQNRRYDDSPTKMAKNQAEADRINKARGRVSGPLQPRPARKRTPAR